MPEGALSTGDDVAPAAKLEARVTLAIKAIEPFNFLYERCKGNKMPSKEFLMDALRETKVEKDNYSECIDTFIINATFLGLLRNIAGSERLITIEHALEESGKVVSSPPSPKIVCGPAHPTARCLETRHEPPTLSLRLSLAGERAA